MVDDKVYNLIRKHISYSSWVIDIEDDLNSCLSGPIKHQSRTGRLAHKLACCNRYKTNKKRQKAFRRLIRLAEKEQPLILQKLVDNAKLDLV